MYHITATDRNLSVFGFQTGHMHRLAEKLHAEGLTPSEHGELSREISRLWDALECYENGTLCVELLPFEIREFLQHCRKLDELYGLWQFDILHNYYPEWVQPSDFAGLEEYMEFMDSKETRGGLVW